MLTEMAANFGRFHLLLLHLPIGFLILAFLLELAARRSDSLRPALRFSLGWGALSAILAAGLGYLLSLGGDYDADLLFWHQWLGIGTAGLSLLLYFLYKNEDGESALKKVRFPLFVVTLLVLTGTGHYGGSLTHGSGYLFKGEEDVAATSAAGTIAVANLDSAEVFADVVLPVLRNKCGGCHNPEKRKGKLELLTQEAILKGGENGAILTPGNPAESKLIKFIHLPTEDDEHMPPKGKKQLLPEEKKLLEWWVSTGAPFGKSIAACNLPDDLRTWLSAKTQVKTSPLDALKLEPVSASALNNLQKEGVKIAPLATGSPFLSVLLADRKDLTPAIFKKLEKVGKNIVHLQLSRSNADDALLASLKNLPNLNRLHLDQCAITDKGLEHLANLQLLEYLNLYQTKVTDAGLAQLKNLKNLRSVYLWQTEVTPAGIAQLSAANPALSVNNGIGNDSMFGTPALKAPLIEASRELFLDTLRVNLKSGFGTAAIHFTLDGSEPDSADAIFDKPLIINASTDFRAFARKEGWKSSEVVKRQFFKVRHQAKDIALAKPSSEKYKGEGGKTLGDLKRGDPKITEGGWIGYEGGHLDAKIDLGSVSEVSGVTVGALENTGNWIFFPKGMRVSVSSDGKNFKLVKQATYPTSGAEVKPSLKNFTEKFAPVQARFLRVEVLSNLKNPKWHPGAGKACWVFVDEIMVE